MKTRGFILSACVCLPILLAAQAPDPAPSPQPVKPIQTLSSVDFEKAFRQAVLASHNHYRDIVSSGMVEILSKPHKRVSFTFPGAIKAGYEYEELPDIYADALCIDKLSVLYFEGDNFSEAVSMYDQVKNLLDQCRRKNIGGTWKMGDGTYLGLTRHGRTFNFERDVEDEKTLRISLVLEYAGTGKATVRMNIDLNHYYYDE